MYAVNYFIRSSFAAMAASKGYYAVLLMMLALLSNWKWKFISLRLKPPCKSAEFCFQPNANAVHVDCNKHEKIKQQFLERIRDPRVAVKLRLAAESWHQLSMASHYQPNKMEATLAALVNSASFGTVYPTPWGSMGGLAGRCWRSKGKLVLGYEPHFSLIGSYLRGDCITHELVHCVQEVVGSTISQESWGCLDIPNWKIESHAIKHGGGISILLLFYVIVIFLAYFFY